MSIVGSSVEGGGGGPAPSPPVRGRPRGFDGDLVLDQALDLFWEKGYEATSVADLVEATGLNKSSLYNAFGSKDELYERAVERYVDIRISMLQAVLRDGSGGLDDVLSLLDLAALEIEGEAGRRGCLAVNMATELGLTDDFARATAERFRAAMLDAFATALERAAAAGEIPPEQVGPYATVLMTSFYGMQVIARGGASLAEQRGYLDAIRALVRGWRAPADGPS